MPTKRDRKRTQRTRRAEHKRQGEVNRRRRRRADELHAERKGDIASLEVMAADQGVTPGNFAARLDEVLRGEGMVAFLSSGVAGWNWGEELAAQVGEERAVALATAITERADHTSGAGWWAGGLQYGGGRRDLAEEVAATLLADEPENDDLRALVARMRLDLGRAVDTAEVALAMCEADPSDFAAQTLLARSLRLMVDRAASPPDDDGCSCGSGRKWSECCAEQEAAMLGTFSDRSRMYALREAVTEFIAADTILSEWWQAAIREWLEVAENEDWDFRALMEPGAPDPAAEARHRLAAESCWVRGPDRDPGEHVDDEDEDSYTILNRFARDETQSEDLRSFARTWQRSACFGFWQVTDPDPRPGLWLTDLVTRREVYAAIPPEEAEGLARWSVLAGCLVPDRGVWRTGAALMVLDPDEGDIAAEMADAAVSNVVGQLAKEKHIHGTRALRTRSPRLGHVPPHGVMAGFLDAIEPPTSQVYHNVVAVALPTFLCEIEARRRQLPRMVNSDKEPVELLKAVASLDDPKELRARLLARPDFEADPNGGRIAWSGREMTALEAETSLAQAREWAAAQGRGPIDEDGEPHRWIRGFLDLDGNQLTIEVNSRARLDAVTRILRKLGVGEVLVERRVDPTLDLPVGGWRPVADAGSPQAEAVWREHWLEEPLPALDGETPRAAAARRGTRAAVRLEALLRRLEFDADAAASEGKRPLDVAALRRELAGEDGVPFSL